MSRPPRTGAPLLVCLAFAFVLLVPGPGVAQPVLTVADGGPVLVRATRFTAVAGVVLRQGDVLEVPAGGMAQVEFDDTSAVALGPGARALLMPGQGPPQVFVLAGPVKLAARGGSRVRLATPHASVLVGDGAVVAQVDAGASSLFAETGAVTIDAGGAGTALAAGGFATVRPRRAPDLAPRPPPPFVAGLPAAFLDALPSRRGRFTGRPAVPMSSREFTYAEVEAWLTSVPAVRRVLVAQWRARAQDPAFRRSLIANMKRHPEWERVVAPAEGPAPEVPEAVLW